jgi:hypothetical protein
VGGYDHTKEKVSTAEWFPGGTALQDARWQPFEAGFLVHKALGQMADGSLVAVDDDGTVSLIRIGADAQGKPQAETSELPPLHQPRLFQNQTDLVVRGLPDGRIIVAGGELQNRRLAVMREDSMEPNAPDEYLRIGEAEPTSDYEIYEPATGQWRLSAASSTYGGLLAVYDDGRVARLSANAGRDALMEISSADGRSWSELTPEELPAIEVRQDTHLFVLQDELFVTGGQGNNTETLQWFNGATRRWETLWQQGPQQNWRDNVGRVIIRQLANGKRVMLPVAGL